MQVRLYATLRHIAGTGRVEVPARSGDSVAVVLSRLVETYPQLAAEIYANSDRTELLPYVAVYVDGRNIHHLQGLATSLKGHETLAVFPPVAGG